MDSIKVIQESAYLLDKLIGIMINSLILIYGSSMILKVAKMFLRF